MFNKKNVSQKGIGDYSSEISEMECRLKKAFSDIKKEFSDHLSSINQNTLEIQSNYESLSEITHKIDKLAERIDEISMYLGLSRSVKEFDIKPLSRREQEVFLVIYTLQPGSYISYSMIARKLALTEDLVQSYVASLIAKGIPVIKKYINNKVHLCLDSHFSSLQAKENKAGINRKISEIFMSHK